ncbi:MAG: (Fe-S)-binding protein [Gammaproteobacteria bacterium]|nr:(Fe-S)-binding protein [Gammaproteobacteria bacterium]
MYDATQKLKHKILADSDRCVMCGLCLPHCPTFKVKRNEADSPRGRILLAKALAEQQLEADENVRAHVESCLHCLHCEHVCPAKVPFGRLIDNTKHYLAEQQQITPLPLWLKPLLASRKLRLLFASVIKLYQLSGIQAWLRKRTFFKRSTIATWDAMLAKREYISAALPHSNINSKQTVALFSGCVATISDQNTLRATRQLLTAAGFKVQLNNKQHCCGAIYRHSGDLEYARHLMLKNSKTFKADIPVISCASGCGAMLQQYDNELSARHYDIHTFIIKHADHLSFRELPETVALHTPCSMQNILKQQAMPKKLLSLIPKLQIVSLKPETGCCGAAGIQILQQQSQGDVLADDTIDAMKESHANILLTSNVGCAMHLRRRIWSRKLDYEVMHPTLLLYRQLQTTKHQ